MNERRLIASLSPPAWLGSGSGRHVLELGERGRRKVASLRPGRRDSIGVYEPASNGAPAQTSGWASDRNRHHGDQQRQAKSLDRESPPRSFTYPKLRMSPFFSVVSRRIRRALGIGRHAPCVGAPRAALAFRALAQHEGPQLLSEFLVGEPLSAP